MRFLRATLRATPAASKATAARNAQASNKQAPKYKRLRSAFKYASTISSRAYAVGNREDLTSKHSAFRGYESRLAHVYKAHQYAFRDVMIMHNALFHLNSNSLRGWHITRQNPLIFQVNFINCLRNLRSTFYVQLSGTATAVTL